MSTTITTTPARTRPELGTPELSLLVRRIASNPRLWKSAVRFGTAERYWTRLAAPDGVDVWLLTWLPSQGTDLHDHGSSAAAFAVVEGTLTEVRADPVLGTWSTAVRAPAVRVVEPGVVHDVRNDHGAPAVSIHAYSPKLTRMTYYDLQEGRLVARREVLGNEPEAAS
jgi:mannose-6-phosphate isomerase-like protein (cupin superfamily)